jgi:molybdate transport system substrate-binding protein
VQSAFKAYILSGICTLAIATSVQAQDMTVFAASSLKTVLDEISQTYAPESGVQISYAGSSVLARQIIQGAPADVYISANTSWMDTVVTAQLSILETPVNIISNRLVLIETGKQTGLKHAQTLSANSAVFSEVAQANVAMGFVDAVPVGQYGKAALEYLDQWTAVKHHVVQTDNARAALALVALGEVPYGVVYATDAAAESRVHIVGEFPNESHPTILYSATKIKGSSEQAHDFLEYLSSEPAQSIFQSHGFVPVSLHD